MEILDPTSELAPPYRPVAPRLNSREGIFGLVDISKPRGDVFLLRIRQLMETRGMSVVDFTKPTHTRPAPMDLRREIVMGCNAVIQALAD